MGWEAKGGRESMEKTNKKSKRVAKKWVDGKGNSMLWLYGSLQFLEPKDIVKVLELNRELRKMFKKKVYRTIFSNFGDIITRT